MKLLIILIIIFTGIHLVIRSFDAVILTVAGESPDTTGKRESREKRLLELSQ